MKNRISFSRKLAALTVMSGLSVAVSPISAALAAPPSIIRASVSSTNEEGNAESRNVPLSANGRIVAFYSFANNLVEGDNNSSGDIFVRDLGTGVTQRVSVDSSGVEGNSGSGGQSEAPSLSADGRFVAFQSDASNLVEGDNNGTQDIFVHDRKTGVTQRMSVDSSGVEGNSNENGIGSFGTPSLSADGRFVAFLSYSSNLVSGDNNAMSDIFVHDRKTGVTQRMSVDSSGVEGNGQSSEPSISANGRFVAFCSFSTNLVEGDNNGYNDVFVHDRKTDVTQRVSVDSSGVEGNGICSGPPSISANGRFVAFCSFSTNLVSGDNNGMFDIFVHDRKTGVTQRVSVDSSGVEGNGGSFGPAISAGGRFIAFRTDSSNLVPEDNNGSADVLVRDLKTGVTQRVSVDSSGVEGNGFSYGPAISAGGRFIAFSSTSSNLVKGDNNATYDIFVRRR